MRKIKQIVVHCSDSCDSLDFGAKEIDSWHKERGWTGIGYHFIIKRNGIIERGRPDEVKGAHVKGHNKKSLGICWVGRNVITRAQYTSLINLVAKLRAEYKVEIEEVKGHSELDPNKTCPNLNMDQVRGDALFANTYVAEEDVRYVPERSQIWE